MWGRLCGSGEKNVTLPSLILNGIPAGVLSSTMKNFNTYIDTPAAAYWRQLCLEEGTVRHYERGDYFFREGEVAKYLGMIQSGTLKYTAYSDDGTEYILGLEFAGGFVSDFPFSFRGIKARTSVIATSPCDILCLPVSSIRSRIPDDPELLNAMLESTEAVFSTVYDRYKDLYTKSPQQRYSELISTHPDIFSLFSLRDIASFLRITPTHLSRLRHKV